MVKLVVKGRKHPTGYLNPAGDYVPHIDESPLTIYASTAAAARQESLQLIGELAESPDATAEFIDHDGTSKPGTLHNWLVECGHITTNG